MRERLLSHLDAIYRFLDKHTKNQFSDGFAAHYQAHVRAIKRSGAVTHLAD